MKTFLLIISFAIIILSSAYAATHRSDFAVNVVDDPAPNPEVTRMVKITQGDNMFLPAEIYVSEGETIRFVVKNGGNKNHEMFIGSMDEIKAYAKAIRMDPDKERSELGLIQLKPGEQKELVWQFLNAGTVEFACPLPGHFKTMRGKILVEKK